MGILDFLGFGKDIAEPIKAIGTLYTTDKDRINAEANLQKAIQPSEVEKIKLNQIFAASSRFFNNGYIPLTGWTVGLLILLFFAPQIIITTYLWGKFCLTHNRIIPFPMSPNDIMALFATMFGLGAHSLFKKN